MTNLTPTKMVALVQILLTQLEQALSQAPTEPLREDERNDHLKSQIDRLKTALEKRQHHDRRKRELEKQNRDNARNR